LPLIVTFTLSIHREIPENRWRSRGRGRLCW